MKYAWAVVLTIAMCSLLLSAGVAQADDPHLIPVLQGLLHKYQRCILESYENDMSKTNPRALGPLRDRATCVAGNMCTIQSRRDLFNMLQAQSNRGDATNFEANLQKAILADCFQCTKHSEFHTKQMHCTEDCKGNQSWSESPFKFDAGVGPCFEGCKAGVDMTKLARDIAADIQNVLRSVSAALTGPPQQQPDLGGHTGIRIVSVGDSYASGEGAPDSWGPAAKHPIWRGDNTDGLADTKCHRSRLAAPVIAADLVKASRPVNFLHLACSGAKISDLINGQLTQPAIRTGSPIDALIVSIGGNNINFAAVVGACLAIPCEPIELANTAATINNLRSAMRTLITKIRGLPVPVRHVFFTEYPDVSTTPFPFPDHRCGTPFAPNVPLSGFEGLVASKAETAALTVINPLNAMIRAVVEEANTVSAHPGQKFHFVSGITQAFHAHGYCMGAPHLAPHMLVEKRMINTLTDSGAIQGDISGTMHPNKDGQAAAGKVIAAAIRANVP